MPNEIIEIINRDINNRFFEAHPFKHCSAGMEAFAKLYHITRKQYPEFIMSNIINKIDELLEEENITNCFSCHMKLLFFAMLICNDKLPEQERVYEEKISTLSARWQRDYFSEVKTNIIKYQLKRR